jgi:hypothetical protein
VIPEMSFAYLSWEAFSTFAAGGLAVLGAWFIATKQLEIQRAQLEIVDRQTRLLALETKAALFERRIEVYDATQAALNELVRTAKFPSATFGNFVIAVGKAELLFPSEVYSRLRKLQGEFADFGLLVETMSHSYAQFGHYGTDGQSAENARQLSEFYTVSCKLAELFGDEVRLVV